jgi:hypothetical protein
MVATPGVSCVSSRVPVGFLVQCSMLKSIGFSRRATRAVLPRPGADPSDFFDSTYPPSNQARP